MERSELAVAYGKRQDILTLRRKHHGRRSLSLSDIPSSPPLRSSSATTYTATASKCRFKLRGNERHSQSTIFPRAVFVGTLS